MGESPILPNVLPKRAGRGRKRKAWFLILGILLGFLTFNAIWYRETIYYIFNPDKIEVKTAAEIRSALHLGGHDLTLEDGMLAYRVLDDAVSVRLALDHTLLRLEAEFNGFEVPYKSIPDAVRKAQTLLSPYLTKPEINALGLLISFELPGLISSDAISYSRPVGGHTLTVNGSAVTGDMFVTCVKEASP